MNASVHRQLARRKRRILRRIENQPGVEGHRPMMAASNIRYEIAERVRGLAPGGIGAIHLLARKLGLVDDIDRDLHLLKRHLPYHESDHVRKRITDHAPSKGNDHPVGLTTISGSIARVAVPPGSGRRE